MVFCMSGQQLRQWIRDRGLKQTEAAFVLGISYPTLTTFLRGAAPSEDTIRRMTGRMAAYDADRASTPKPAA